MPEETLATPGLTETAHSDSHGIHVSLAPETIATIGSVPITNTLLMSWVSIAILLTIIFILGSRLKMVPGKFQTLIETVVLFMHDFVSETLESEKWTRRAFPLILAIFLFIFTSNLIEFTPGIGSIGFFSHGGAEFVPLFRSVNTDLNVTLALAIIVVIAIEIMGIIAIGFSRYAGKFINFSSPVGFVVGLIELVSETARLVSFSFRLFGNIFAGEVLIAVVTFFAPYIVPAPLMAFETFVGFIQAAVFALLTLFFLKLAITDPHEAH
ncbi:F0F1 ATP synthase subunit A [Candidatus Kaiserbacteria bacterium]|nr:F0F1 ATP synthase subunit A [Candidatus Kaiserbacteria bacterium]